MARGKRKDIKTVTTKQGEQVDTVRAKILIPLYHAYNLGGKQGEIRDIPTHLVDELVRLKRIELV